ncbi:MAG: hypothetical protein OXG35_28415, partial [Acidobacteria bacterium]|nr:hypothetical protein [Acidobacteriota bacterium]
TYQTRPSSSRWKVPVEAVVARASRDDPQAEGLGRPSGSEVVPAGTADRGDVLGGVSAGTVPTAGGSL